MKYAIRKFFCNYEKEEKWLNEMSAKGMALTDYSWGRYVFEETPYNEYTYRIELLENLPTHPESVAYIKFLEDNGVEFVASYIRWIYLRKKSSDGDFDIYSDVNSKISHYKRILAFWNVLLIVNAIPCLVNLITLPIFYFQLTTLDNFPIANLIVGLSNLLIVIFIILLKIPFRKKIKKLKTEKSIRE